MARSPVANLWWLILPALVLTVGFFLLPILYVGGMSFSGPDGPGLENYQRFFASGPLSDGLGRSLLLAVLTVAFSTLIAYPLAYFLSFVVSPKRRILLLFLLVAPFWTSFTIRAFSWQLVLADGGIVASFIGLFVDEPVQLGFLYTFPASVFGLVLFGAMLMTLLLVSAMATIDRRLIEASSALGARPATSFREIVLPLSLPGWIVGAVLTFIVAIGDYAVPTLLGGGFRPVLAQQMISVLKGTYDLPLAATMATVLALAVVVAALPLAFLGRQARMAT